VRYWKIHSEIYMLLLNYPSLKLFQNYIFIFFSFNWNKHTKNVANQIAENGLQKTLRFSPLLIYKKINFPYLHYSLVQIAIMLLFPICFWAWNFTIFCLGLYNKQNITRWLEDMTFIFSCFHHSKIKDIFDSLYITSTIMTWSFKA
jgi:hypothetical protein